MALIALCVEAVRLTATGKSGNEDLSSPTQRLSKRVHKEASGYRFDINRGNAPSTGTHIMICYEWIVEELEDGGSDPDIIDTNGYPTLAEARSHADSIKCRGGFSCIGLVRDVGNEWDGLTDRQWAYLDADGALPDEFDDGASIPRRFFKEAAA